MKKLIYTALALAFALSLQAEPKRPAFIVAEEFIFDEAPFKECHASSIESTPSGLIATWFGGTKEGNVDVEIWTSRFAGGKWTAPLSVANGIQEDGTRFACWNPVLFQIPNGDLLLFYKVGKSSHFWWTFLKRSKDGGITWQKEERLPDGFAGPIKNKPFLTADGRLICPSARLDKNKDRHMYFDITKDFGKTWTTIGPIKDPRELGATQPSILSYNNGKTLQALARTLKGSVLLESWSHDGGLTWTDASPTHVPNPNSGTDAVTLREGFQILIYNHTVKPMKNWSGPRHPINIGISVDGLRWHNVAELDTEKGELSYPAVIQSKDGMVHITYTWKRQKIKHVVIDPQKLLGTFPKIKKEFEEKLGK